eukprot:9503759-Pyramimonas_sp.AAC.2
MRFVSDDETEPRGQGLGSGTQGSRSHHLSAEKLIARRINRETQHPRFQMFQNLLLESGGALRSLRGSVQLSARSDHNLLCSVGDCRGSSPKATSLPQCP